MTRWLTISAAMVAFLAIPVSGAAGGGATFDFPTDYPVIGDTVTGRTEVWLGSDRTAGLEDGPFHAYLVPIRARYPERGLPEEATWLAPISFEPRPGPYARATVTFEVPPVPPGAYSLSICNDPCTDLVVGDLVGGWVTIAVDADQAGLFRLQDDVEMALRRVRAIRATLGHRTREAERSVESLSQQMERMDVLERGLALRVTALERQGADQRGPSPVAYAGWAAAGALAAASIVGRVRRRPRPPTAPGAPDPVEWILPEEDRVTAGT